MKKKLNFDFAGSSWFAALVLGVLTWFGYLNVISAPFILDDVWGIRDNPSAGDASQIFAHPVSFLRAFMIFVSYTIGHYDPAAYRMFNFAFHFGTALMLFLIIRELFNRRYAWMASVMYVVHPILIEAVTWISSLPSPQYSFFFMLSLFCYIKFNKVKNIGWYIGSIAACIFSLLSAEKAVVLPAVIVLTEISFFSIKKHWKYTIPFFVLAILSAASIFLHIGERVQSFQQNFYVERIIYNPLIHWPYSITSYLQMIFWPYNLTIYHADESLSIPLFVVRCIIFVIFVAGIIVSYKKARPIFYWLMFFIITLSPTMLPINIVWMVAERYAYLATAGVIAAAAYPLYLLSKKKKYTALVYIFVGLCTIGLLIKTISRNSDWQSEDDLWIATVKNSPYSPNAHNNMGDYYMRHNDVKNAIREFSLSVKLKPNYGDAYHNLGLAFLADKQYDNALAAFKQAVKLNPRLWQSLVNLALLYNAAGKQQEAHQYAVEARKYGPPDNSSIQIMNERIK